VGGCRRRWCCSWTVPHGGRDRQRIQQRCRDEPSSQTSTGYDQRHRICTAQCCRYCKTGCQSCSCHEATKSAVDLQLLAFVVRSTLGGSPAEMPLRKLFGFERFSSVRPGESRTAFFASTADSLGVVGLDGAKRLHPGRYRIEVGPVQAPVVHELELIGERPLLVEQNAWTQRLAHGQLASPWRC
jgi:hypothetical protein